MLLRTKSYDADFHSIFCLGQIAVYVSFLFCSEKESQWFSQI